MGLPTVVAVAMPRDEEYTVDHGRKERKVMRLTENVGVVGGSKSLLASWTTNGFDRVSSEQLTQIMGFLDSRDRFALLCSQKTLLLNEPLATMPMYTSFCGRCVDCMAKNQHLCKEKDNARDASFWVALLRYTGRDGACALRELRLSSCDKLTAATLRSCGAQGRKMLAGLRVLDLHACSSLQGDGLHLLAEMCTQLEEVHFRDMDVDPVAFARLIENNHKTLRVVDLLGCHTVTGDDVRHLMQCARLDDLSLWGCHNVDNASIAAVVDACRQLTRLNLRYCHKVDDALVEEIARCLPNLRDLNLRYCFKLTDRAVEALCEQVTGLENLNLSQCAKITDAAITRVASSLKSLKELRLWGCTKLTLAAVCAISDGLPALTLVDIRKLKAVIGGSMAVELLVKTCRDRMTRWEQADEAGVFTRPLSCAVAA